MKKMIPKKRDRQLLGVWLIAIASNQLCGLTMDIRDGLHWLCWLYCFAIEIAVGVMVLRRAFAQRRRLKQQIKEVEHWQRENKRLLEAIVAAPDRFQEFFPSYDDSRNRLLREIRVLREICAVEK